MSLPLRVLLVEDSEADAALILRELRRGGYEPSFARVETAAAMQAAFAEQPCDIVIADHSLPSFSAPAALRLMQESGLDLPFIIVSGVIGEEEAVAAMKAGAHDYIMKGNLARLNPSIVRELREAEVRRERRRSDEEVAQRRRQAEVVTELASTLNASLDLDAVLQRTAEGVKELCASDIVSIGLRDLRSETILIRHRLGTRYQGYESVHIQPGQGIGGQAIISGLPFRTDQYAEDPRVSQEHIEVIRAEGIRSAMAVPIRIGDRVEGVIYVANRTPRPFTQRDEGFLLRLADHAAIAIHNAWLFEQVRAGRERLQSLSRRLVEVQEAERRHIARELHDEVGKLLTGLKLALDTSVHGPGDVSQASLLEVQALVNELMGRVRELSLDLRPSMLDDLGLLPALSWYIEHYTARTDIRVALEHAGLERRFTPAMETAAYRIVEEALTNVARHADVHEVTVRVWTDPETLRLQIEDRGTGFDTKAIPATTTSGLAGMYERAMSLGGLLSLESIPGAGTRVTAELPLVRPLERRSRER